MYRFVTNRYNLTSLMEANRWKKGKLIRFSLITTTLALLLLEGVFRLIFHFEYNGYKTSVYIQGSAMQMPDAALIWRNRPFYVDVCKRFQFNEEGMKSTPARVQMPVKKPGDLWVFLFGGSTMEGMGSNPNGEWLDITGVTDHGPESTIAGYLEQMLQDSLPLRKVQVFNAAASGYTIQQSMLRYQQLAGKYAMDWVVSLDGHNDPPALAEGQSVRNYLQNDWDTNAVFRFPRNITIPVTAHSALAGKIKQTLFLWKLRARLERNNENGFPKRDYWLRATSAGTPFAPYNKQIALAVDTFVASLLQFDEVLKQAGQPHLLLVQPHLAFRDTSVLAETEKALFSYYVSLRSRATQNTWLQHMYAAVRKSGSSRNSIQLLTEMNNLPLPVFVDYCHFTQKANKYVARRIAEHIISNTH